MRERFDMLIGGKWVYSGRELKVMNPYDSTLVAKTCLAGVTELNMAVDAASSAFEVTRKLPSYKRAEIIQKVVNLINERAEELARIITLEAGKPISDSRREVKRTANTFQIALEEAKRQGGEVLPLDIMPGAEGRFAIIRRFPVGVVLGISPFNFPLNLVAHKIAPTMACGNSIILKPASKTPLSALALGGIITDAGWPDGGVNIVPSAGADVERLMDDSRIKKVTFTGSAPVGWKLKARAGSRKITLELGGNAGVIVHDDADIDAAAKRCAFGAFAFAGQVCISVQRVYAHRSIFDRFVSVFIDACKGIKAGDPMDESTGIGPMIDADALSRTASWVKEAVSGGARLLTGGTSSGNIFLPTALTGTNLSMKVCSEEVFAPVVVIEPYDDFEEALGMVNSGAFGLQAGVFTKDASRIFRAYERLEVGGVIGNDIPTFRVDNMPYGGVKQSGFGREGVRYAIEEMTELKMLALNV